MPSIEDIETWRGRDVLDREGNKIGSLEEVYVDEETGQPEFACVKTGLFGRRLTFVPLNEAGPDDAGIRLPYSKDQVRDAPSIEPDGNLSPDEEQRLYRHYGLDRTGAPSAEGGADVPRSRGEDPADETAGAQSGAGAQRPRGEDPADDTEGAQSGAGAQRPRGEDPADDTRRARGAAGERPAAGIHDDAANAAGDRGEGRPRLRRSTGGLADGIDERIRVHTQSMGREHAARLDELEQRIAAIEREIGAASRPA